MTQMTPGSTLPRRPAPSSNIYTVLVVIALVALLFGIIYVVIRNNTLFNTYNVFNIDPPSATGDR
jgi:hypothetical protein